MKRVLIFGIAGFVGGYLAQEFHHAGYEVFGSDIQKTASVPNYVFFIEADLLNAASVENILKNSVPDYVVNLAAVSNVGISWSIPQKTINVNVNGTLNILEVARKMSKMPQILLVGSSEEYAVSEKPISEEYEINANNPYGISKIMQERLAEIYMDKYRMKIYCVRSFNHTGIGQNDKFVLPSFCRQVAEIEKSGKAGVISVGNLSARRDFSDVRDIVRAYRMVLESGKYHEVYNVGSGRAYKLSELLEYLISLSGQKIIVQVDKNKIRPVDNPYICCDNRKIKEELGWELEMDIFDTLKEMYVENMKEKAV